MERASELGHVILVSLDSNVIAAVVDPLRSRKVMVTVLQSWNEIEEVMCQIKPDLALLGSRFVPGELVALERSSLFKSKVPIVLLSEDRYPASRLTVSHMNVVLKVSSHGEPFALVSMVRRLLDDMRSGRRPRIF